MPAVLVENAERDGDALFLVDDQGSLTKGQTVDLARGMTHALARVGVTAGQTAAIMLDNRREFIASWFGLACLGAIEVPVNPANRGERLVHILNHSQSRLLVVQRKYLPQVNEVADGLVHLERVIIVDDADDAADVVASRIDSVNWTDLEFDEVAGRLNRPHFSEPVAVMYTSGSTGPAKGVVLSHGHHWTNGSQPTRLFDIDPEDTVYCCLPLHHNMAQGYGVWVALVSGGAIRVAPKFNAETFWHEIRDSRATILPFVGAMLVLVAKRPPEQDDRANSLRIGYGVPIPPDLHVKFEERFGLELVHAYGSTEATIVAWNYGPDRVLGAAGKIMPDYDVRIVDTDGSQAPAATVGEIVVRPTTPNSMFSEYWRDPERTVEAWRDLWFHTGDRGRIDDAGNLWFVDRASDVVRRMGEFINPMEVEQAAVAHPEVQLAAAFGVPSELGEEELMLVAVRQPGSDVDAAEIRDWLAARLPRYAVPRFVDFQAELPLTPTGKIEKYKLKKVGVTATTNDIRTQKGSAQ